MSDFTFLDPGDLRDGELLLELLERKHANPEKGYVPEYVFALLVDGKDAGRLRFRAGTTPLLDFVGGHLGYDVNEAYRGNHYAERACRLVVPLAQEHGFDALVITCNPDNHASRRTCERLGADFIGIVDVPEGHEMRNRGETQKRRYVLNLS